MKPFRPFVMFTLVCLLAATSGNVGGCAEQRAQVATVAGDVQSAAHDAAASGDAKASKVEQIAMEIGAAASDPAGYAANFVLQHKTGTYAAIGLAVLAKYLPGIFGIFGLGPKKPADPATPAKT